MRLQLDSNGIQGANAAYGAEAAGIRKEAGPQARQPGDSVGLTGVSRALQTDSANRNSRIDSLAAAVRAGTYSVSSSKISQSIITGAGG